MTANLSAHTKKGPLLTWFGSLLVLACAFLLVSIAAAQTERIPFYHSDIKVQDDGTMLVREMIRVVSNGDQIRHGIYRDFPTHYTDRLGNHYVVGFKLLAATRDGARKNRASKTTTTASASTWAASTPLWPPANTLTASHTRQTGNSAC